MSATTFFPGNLVFGTSTDDAVSASGKVSAKLNGMFPAVRPGVLPDHAFGGRHFAVLHYSNDTAIPAILLGKSRGDTGQQGRALNGDGAGNLDYIASNGVNFVAVNRISSSLPIDVLPGGEGYGNLLFWTNAGAGLTIRAFFKNGGAFVPGTDNAYTTGDATNRWSAVWAANGVIQTSDARLKTNVANSVLGLSFINSLRPVSYKWIEGGKKPIKQLYRDSKGKIVDEKDKDAQVAEVQTESIPGSRTHWGLIAQELKAACDAAGVDFGGWILSDSTDPDSTQAVRYDQLIAPLIKAIQELSAKVSALENKVGI